MSVNAASPVAVTPVTCVCLSTCRGVSSSFLFSSLRSYFFLTPITFTHSHSTFIEERRKGEKKSLNKIIHHLHECNTFYLCNPFSLFPRERKIYWQTRLIFSHPISSSDCPRHIIFVISCSGLCVCVCVCVSECVCVGCTSDGAGGAGGKWLKWP